MKPFIIKDVETGDTATMLNMRIASKLTGLDEGQLSLALETGSEIGGYEAWYPEDPALATVAVPIEEIEPNDWNPNHVAPPEMKLLYRSVKEDGYTMPVVCSYITDEDKYRIVDGYHRYTTMETHKDIMERSHGCLPVSILNKQTKAEYMASTIRHNRARGEHAVEAMVNITTDLVQSGMSDAWIMKQIGMDAEELLRMKQLSGLQELFKDKDFSRSWDVYAEDE